jgi:outer membrane lipopolysaccharide assembly protein LptE/RlpB
MTSSSGGRVRTSARRGATAPFPGLLAFRLGLLAPLLAPALALSLASSGCGVYSTRPGSLPSHIRTIAIPTFENLTTQAGLDDEITRSIVDRFVADNNLRVVGEPEADAVLTGSVSRYDNAVFGFTGNVQAEEYRVSITVSCRLFDKAKNREIWHDENLTKTANYYVVEVPGQPAQTEIDGRQEAIQKISDEILSRTVDVW